MIRKNDQKHIIFFESAVADYIEIGFKEGPGGSAFKDRNAYSFHIYCPYVNNSGVPKNELLCHEYDTTMIEVRTRDADKLGLAGLMTEFGALDSTKGGLTEANFIMYKADLHLLGHIYWNFKTYDDITTSNLDGTESLYYKNGTLQTAKVKVLSRPYPKSVFGNLRYIYYNEKTEEFSLDFTIFNDSCLGETEMYYNEKMNYPNGIYYYINEQNAFQVLLGHNSIILRQISQLSTGKWISFVMHKR